MKNFYVSRCLRGFLALSVIALLLFGNTPTVSAEEKTDRTDPDVTITQSAEVSDADMAEIFSVISSHEMSDGDSFVSGNYQYTCEVTIEPDYATDEFLQSKNIASLNASTASWFLTIEDYTAICDIYVTLQGSTVSAVTISHRITVYTYDTGQIHIYSGSLSATPHYSNWSTYVFGYYINNTNGTYSSACGYTRLYNSNTGIYTYYRCFVSITPGSYPSFSFSLV